MAGAWAAGERAPPCCVQCSSKQSTDSHGPKPYKFIRFGDSHGPKPYKLIGFGDSHGPKPYTFIGFGDVGIEPGIR